MESTIVPIRIPRRPASYAIAIGSGMLADVGTWSARTLQRDPGRALVVSNRKVFGLYGNVVLESLSRSGFETHVELIGDGERFKNLRTLGHILTTLSEKGFTRTDAVVALGGGVVGDLAGFAASIHLRGIDLLQIPTTLLSMIDSSVGGKTGVNTAFGKNLVGSFYQPAGVLIDIATLRTLHSRELTAGFCEAIKQGAISSRKLFDQTSSLVDAFSSREVSRKPSEQFTQDVISFIAEQVKFKAKIVQNDESESVTSVSSRSRKILNFGHTFAHALEKATNYRRFKHGEAVGYGIIFAAQLSKKLELLGQDEVNSLSDVVHRAGVLPALADIDQSRILKSFKYDKKRVGNSLHWVLLRDIGKPVIVPDTDIPRSAVLSTLKSTFQK